MPTEIELELSSMESPNSRDSFYDRAISTQPAQARNTSPYIRLGATKHLSSQISQAGINSRATAEDPILIHDSDEEGSSQRPEEHAAVLQTVSPNRPQTGTIPLAASGYFEDRNSHLFAYGESQKRKRTSKQIRESAVYVY